ncbi:cadherin repeat domain-containing protein [Aquimarina algiphila]|uniref:cadherin repeat domain-containing protein n=1 Tax=Aquimarina algiphila TaxID=2047982 RepID=UPI00232C7198|nr:cadherin repeat domain-containing protein [Aquimarina algiphila]
MIFKANKIFEQEKKIKTMKTIKHTLYTFTLLLLITSCSKDDGPAGPQNPEPENPVAQNTAPELTDQSFTVAENITDTTVIGAITATDAEEDALTYSIATNSNDVFSVTSTGELSLTTGKLLDYDVAQSHTIIVEVSDNITTTKATVTINVTNSIDVYVVGYETSGTQSVATLWKNGVASSLSTNKSRANSIFVSNGNIYVAGWEHITTTEVATLWKNGISSPLTNFKSEANDVHVSGDDIYVAGYQKQATDRAAILWKNGIATALQDGKMAKSVHVSSTGSVYVAGYGLNATLWTDYIPYELDPYFSEANSVSTSDNGLTYVVGTALSPPPGGGFSATLWVSTSPKVLSLNKSSITSSYYSKGSLYMIGEEKNILGQDLPTLWINEDATTFSNDATLKLKSIFVFNDDIYIVGSKNNEATLWINGEATKLGGANSDALSVFVKL